jgi:release factor glutamine methyltransferase
MTATVRELLTAGTRRLARVVKDNPQLASEYLLRSLLNLKKIDIYLEPDRSVSAGLEVEFWSLVNRKLEHEPLQYIVGSTEWYGLTVKCDRRALVPRPETEIVTERAIELLKEIAQPRVADIGTGTGAIAIAVGMNLAGAHVAATDSSADALALAEENVSAHNLGNRIELKKGELLEPLDSSNPFDLIISNPPYIRTGEFESLMPEVRDYEPSSALIAGEDGLDVIRPLIQRAPEHLRPGGWLVLEFGIDHSGLVTQIAGATGRYEKPVIIVDYNQQDRGVILRVAR